MLPLSRKTDINTDNCLQKECKFYEKSIILQMYTFTRVKMDNVHIYFFKRSENKIVPINRRYDLNGNALSRIHCIRNFFIMISFHIKRARIQ